MFVIDLNRLPSHGREMGVWLRNQKATRHVPLVFVQGEPDKTERVRELLPDAVYADWRHIHSAIRQAMRHAPHAPVMPGTFDSYSGTPLPKKLGINAGAVVALLGVPKDFERTLGELPAQVRLLHQARGQASVILLFVTAQADLDKRFASAARLLSEGGRLWIVWPKKASGVPTDLTQSAVRQFGLSAGLVDWKVSAIDATWPLGSPRGGRGCALRGGGAHESDSSFMEKRMKNNRCLSCDRTEQETPLLVLQYAGRETWICPQCLPVLIHHADQLEDKLAALRQAMSPNRAVSA